MVVLEEEISIKGVMDVWRVLFVLSSYSGMKVFYGALRIKLNPIERLFKAQLLICLSCCVWLRSEEIANNSCRFLCG